MACGQSGYGWERTSEVPALLGQTTEVSDPNDNANSFNEPDIVLPNEEQPVESSLTTSAQDPLAANNGTHTYSSKSYNFTCICQEAGTIASNFIFTDNSVQDGDFIYTKTGENTYTRSWIGYSILVIDGKETTIDVPKATALTFYDNGYVMENFSDESPETGAPCCYYEFTLAD